MPPGFSLSVSLLWYEQQTDCSPCSICKDVIVTNMFLLVLSAGPVERFENIESRIKICAPCMELINKEKEAK